MEPHIREAARQIVDRVATRDDVVDFVPNLAAELPLVVIAELLGIPYEDRHKVFEWSNRLIGANDPEYAGDGADAPMNASMELYAYAQSLADDRRARPMDDIVTTLVTAELDGEKLSDIEFNVFVLLLSVAGNETTRNLISGGMLAADGEPRPAGPAGRRPRRAAADRGRRDAALRQPGAVLPAHRDRRHRAPRRADRGRRQGDDLVRRGEPRRGGVRRPAVASTSAAPRTSTSRSAAAARTSASARAWRRWRSG